MSSRADRRRKRKATRIESSPFAGLIRLPHIPAHLTSWQEMREDIEHQPRLVAMGAARQWRYHYNSGHLPRGRTVISFGGYGDDPRELSAVPEVKSFLLSMIVAQPETVLGALVPEHDPRLEVPSNLMGINCVVSLAFGLSLPKDDGTFLFIPELVDEVVRMLHGQPPQRHRWKAEVERCRSIALLEHAESMRMGHVTVSFDCKGWRVIERGKVKDVVEGHVLRSANMATRGQKQ